MHSGYLNVAVSNLLGLRTESHLVELPSLSENIKRRLKIFLAEVNLSDDLQNLAIGRMSVTKNLLVHLQ